MIDEITQKHLDNARVRSHRRGHSLQGWWRVRALELSLDNDFTVEQLQAAQSQLAQVAATQGLKVLEQPLFALANDPMQDVPHEWDWSLLQPVRGPAKPDSDAGVSVSRIQGGAYVYAMTQKGFPDLRNLYTYFLGEFLPSRKQQLTRPLIYHRVVAGLNTADPRKLALEVFIPIQLSLARPMRLVDREDMT